MFSNQLNIVMTKVAMIGVGKLGQDCAEIMAEQYDVVGYDVDMRTPSFPMRETIKEAVEDRDIIFIAAPTPHDPLYGGETPTSYMTPKDFDYTIVSEILEEVNKYVNPNQLVILISTVLPGTVRHTLRPLITNARFIYNPYLIAMGTVKWDMVNPEMIIIGTEDGSTTGDAKELIDFYAPLMKNDPRIEVGTWDEAEAIKIFYNTFISTKVALVNMIQDVAEKSGNIDVDIVTNALSKSTHRIMGPAYMTAGMGDGGACHPRDNIALREMAYRLDLGYDLFDSIMTARERQAYNLALKCREYGSEVTIIGKAYKPNVPYTHGSSSLLVGYYLKNLGVNVNYYDVHTGDLFIPYNITNPIFLIGYWEQWVEEFPFPPNSIVIDPWRKMQPNCNIAKIIHYGNTRAESISNTALKYSGTVSPYYNLIWDELGKHADNILLLSARRGCDSIFNMSDETIVEIINDHVAQGKKFIVIDNSHETFTSKEITRIYNIVPNINIDASAVYYLTASSDASEKHTELCLANEWNNPINIVELRTFEQVVTKNYIRVDTSSPYVIGPREKKFLCMNRIPHLHRICLLGLMASRELINEGFYSYYDSTHTFNDHIIKYAVSYTPVFKDAIIKSLLDIRDSLPLRLTLDEHGSNPTSLNETDAALFQNSYFSVIPETYCFDDTNLNDLNSIFFSEKTFNAISMKHPFILLGRPGSLEALRKFGYKTFHPYIDETYDTIESHEDRLVAIVNEIERLTKLTDTEWTEWQNNIRTIVEHNHAVLRSRSEPLANNNIKLGDI
jgi:UDPglucose 6-dehydrogenase